jgi:hypothetical protein
VNRSTLRRLTQLEAAQPKPLTRRPLHQIIIEEGEDPEQIMAAMIAAGEAQKGDNFIINIIVDPKPEAFT